MLDIKSRYMVFVLKGYIYAKNHYTSYTLYRKVLSVLPLLKEHIRLGHAGIIDNLSIYRQFIDTMKTGHPQSKATCSHSSHAKKPFLLVKSGNFNSWVWSLTEENTDSSCQSWRVFHLITLQSTWQKEQCWHRVVRYSWAGTCDGRLIKFQILRNPSLPTETSCVCCILSTHSTDQRIWLLKRHRWETARRNFWSTEEQEANKRLQAARDWDEKSDRRSQVQLQHCFAKQHTNQNEQYSRLWNLKILFIPEKSGTTQKTPEENEREVWRVFHDLLGLLHITPEHLDAVHRIGEKRVGRTRPIIVCFVSQKTWLEVLRKQQKLKGSDPKVVIIEDLTRSNH